MLNKNLLVSMIMVAGLAVGASASAQVYVGGTVGQSKWNVDCKEAGVTCDKSTNAYKLVGGYNIDKNFALEASYFSLGKMQANAKIGTVNATAEAKGTGFELAGVLKHDFENGFGAFAKAGVARVKADMSASVPSTFKLSDSTTSTQPVLGLGLTYAVSKEIALRGEIESRRIKIGTDKNTVNTVSLGVQYAF